MRKRLLLPLLLLILAFPTFGSLKGSVTYACDVTQPGELCLALPKQHRLRSTRVESAPPLAQLAMALLIWLESLAI